MPVMPALVTLFFPSGASSSLPKVVADAVWGVMSGLTLFILFFPCCASSSVPIDSG